MPRRLQTRIFLAAIAPLFICGFLFITLAEPIRNLSAQPQSATESPRKDTENRPEEQSSLPMKSEFVVILLIALLAFNYFLLRRNVKKRNELFRE